MNKPHAIHPAARISREEWRARVDLAAMYRLAAMFGYDDIIWNHITMRAPGDKHEFLLNRFGLLYSEVTASNLIKVDTAGKALDDDDVNATGFIIHGAIHLAYPEKKVVFHAHAPAALAVAALQDGLEHLVQDTAMLYGEIGYHDWQGLSLSLDEQEQLAEAMRGKSCLILRNHGFLTTGATAGEAFMRMHYLVRGCQVMLQARATGLALAPGADKIWQNAHAQYETFPPGKYEWPALLRLLDGRDPSYKT